MGLKTFKPITPGMRQLVRPDFSEITKSKPERSLLQPLRKSGGRKPAGRLTVRHRGGGHKRMYRVIDFKRRDKAGVPGVVHSIEYDPNRSARIAHHSLPRRRQALHSVAGGREGRGPDHVGAERRNPPRQRDVAALDAAGLSGTQH